MCNYLNRKESVIIYCIVAVFIVDFIFLGGIISWGIIISNMPAYRQIKCTDTTCLVQVVGKTCLAKFEFYPDSEFTIVDCDKNRVGYYNTTLACDYDKETKEPVLKCTEKTAKDRHELAIILVALICGVLLLIATMISFYAIIYLYHEKYLDEDL